MKRIKSTNIISRGKLLDGYVYYENGRIVSVTDRELPFDEEYDAGSNFVSAGFIDIHTHGGGGFSFEGEVSDVINGVNFHLTHGTTSICPTVSAAPIDDMRRSLGNIKAAMSDGRVMAYIIGAHLEGPYLSLAQTGAQAGACITFPIKNDYVSIVSDYRGTLARWTYAPENDQDTEFAEYMRGAGVLTSAGHTNATYTDMKRALDAGCALVTHLYSCTSTVTRDHGFRSLGVIESTFLEDGIVAEIIADGKHLPPELIRMIYKIKGSDGIVAVTDSLSLAGTDVKMGRMSSTDFIIEDGVCKLLDRSAFAGSIATADVLLRVLTKETGIPITDAVKMLTENPARVMGLTDKGLLEEGYGADIVVFDSDISVKAVFVSGEKRV
ncbi:MAG: N-acetylglucosamine-6-phosphate deacetylase [Clostridia bacterium]|nr:N-acetylglucosamine-6-phosphate deacetylase [Clostridia bacterium]